MNEFSINKADLERFKSAYHAQTGNRIDDDMALFYFEITRDRKLVIDIVSNCTETVNKFINVETIANKELCKNIISLQEGIKGLTLKTDEKRASFLSLILRFYHRRSLVTKYILGLLFVCLLATPSYFLYNIYHDIRVFKSEIHSLKYTKATINGKVYKAAPIPEGAYVKKGILYLPTDKPPL